MTNGADWNTMFSGNQEAQIGAWIDGFAAAARWPAQVPKLDSREQQERERLRLGVLAAGPVSPCPACGGHGTDWWDGFAGCLDCHHRWAIG